VSLKVADVESPLNMIGLKLVQNETVVCLAYALYLSDHRGQLASLLLVNVLPNIH